MRALFGILILVFTAVAAGVAGFQAGVASNVAAAGGVVWLGGGFPGLGFLFFLLFIGFLFFAFAGRRGRGPWGMHPGSRYWAAPGEGDPRRQWIAEAHRRLHEEEAREASAPSGGTPTTPGAAAG